MHILTDDSSSNANYLLTATCDFDMPFSLTSMVRLFQCNLDQNKSEEPQTDNSLSVVSADTFSWINRVNRAAAEGYSPSQFIAAELIACDERRAKQRRSAEHRPLLHCDYPMLSFRYRSQGYLFKRSHNKFKTWSR